MYRKTSSAISAVNGIPTAATHGFKLRGANVGVDGGWGNINQAMVGVKSTAGSGTMVCKVAVWGYDAEAGTWSRFKFLNAGADIAETSADSIQYEEVVDGLRHFDRIYIELVSLGGTTPAFDLYIRSRSASNVSGV